MEKKTVIISALIIAIIIIGLFLTFQVKTFFSPFTSINCSYLSFNGEQKISILFFANEAQTKKYSDELFSIAPFKENQDQFNILYSKENINCELYQEKALFCHSRDLLKKASQCPSDYIVAIKPLDAKIRSSSYSNVLSINSESDETVILHEFAHAFASLADEYVPATVPKNSKNCADSCNNFQQKEGCFEGCSKSNLYRSIDSGIMRSLSSNSYGTFNENILLSKINSNKNSLTGNAISETPICSTDKYYLIEGTYSNNQLNITHQSIESGFVGTNGDGEFNYTLISQNQKEIAEGFNINIIFTDDSSSSLISGGAEEYSGPFTLRIPYCNKAKELVFDYKDQQQTLNLIKGDNRPCPV